MTQYATNLDGTLTTGIVLVLFPSQSGAGAIIERAPDSASTYGTFTQIGTLETVDMGGSPFFDYLPLDNTARWYRVKASEAGWNDGPYTVPFRAIPKPIPLTDWSSKPWLVSNIIPLQLVMDVVTDSSSSLYVTASVNRDPAGLGTPTVNLISYNGLAASPTPSGTAGWIIQKPASGFGRVIFQNYLPGRTPDTDAVDVQAGSATSASQFLALNLTMTASSAEWVGVSASVYNPSAVSTNVSIVTSQNVGTITSNGTNKWTINRPSSGEGTVTFLVTGSANVISDTDTLYVSKDPLPYLTVRGTVDVISPTAMTASVYVYDSNNTTSTLSGITLSPSYTSLSGMSSTLTNTTYNVGETVYTFYIVRPNYGQGTGRVTYTATKTGFTQDSDSIEVPERVDNLARLSTIATVTSMTEDNLIVSVSCSDPLGLVSPSVSYSISPGNSLTVTGANPYTLTRPVSGSSRVTWTGTATGRVPDSDAVDVTARGSIYLDTIIKLLPSTYPSYSWDVTGSDYTGGTPPTLVIVSSSGALTLTTVSSTTYTSGSGASSASYYAASYAVCRPTSASNAAQYTFTAVKSGRLEDTDWIDVQPQTGSGGGTAATSSWTPAFITDIYRSTYNTTDDWLEIGWDVTNAPTAATYSIRGESEGNLIAVTKNVSGSQTFHHERTGSFGHGINITTDSAGTQTSVSYQITVKDGNGNSVGASMWTDITVWKV